jgi:hypothetical protein
MTQNELDALIIDATDKSTPILKKLTELCHGNDWLAVLILTTALGQVMVGGKQNIDFNPQKVMKIVNELLAVSSRILDEETTLVVHEVEAIFVEAMQKQHRKLIRRTGNLAFASAQTHGYNRWRLRKRMKHQSSDAAARKSPRRTGCSRPRYGEEPS